MKVYLEDRRGGAILVVIYVVLIAEALIAIGLLAGLARTRAVADERWAIEGDLIAKSALAEARGHFATGAAVPEGATQRLSVARLDGWSWAVEAVRVGDLVRLAALVQRTGPDGVPIAGSRATLLLRRLASDTLVRLPSHSGF